MAHLRLGALAFGLVTALAVPVATAAPAGASGPGIVVTPASAQPGSTVTVSGSGCLPGLVLDALDRVVINIAGITPVTTTVKPDGSWTAQVVLPVSGLGNLNVSARCLSDGILGSLLEYTNGVINVVTGGTAPSAGVTVPLPGNDVQVGIPGAPNSVPATIPMRDGDDTIMTIEIGGDDTPVDGKSNSVAAGANGTNGANGTAGASGAAGADGTATGTDGSASASASATGAVDPATGLPLAAGQTAAGAADTGADVELASVDCPAGTDATECDTGTSWWVILLAILAGIGALAAAGSAVLRHRFDDEADDDTPIDDDEQHLAGVGS